MNCIIVDDDPMSRKVLEQMTKETGMLDLRHSFASSVEAFNYLDENHADLIFLDIEMPDLNGLEFLQNMPDHPLVIFTTGNKDYALEAYDHRTVDYLVKPIEYSRFLKSVLKARGMLSKDDKAAQTWDFIMLKSEGVFIKTFYKDIVFIEALGDYINVNTTTKKISLHTTMKTFTGKLPPDFLRVHRSFIINISYLGSIEDNTISLNEGTHIPLGVSYREEVYRILNL